MWFIDSSDCLVMIHKGTTRGTFHVLFWSVPKPGGKPTFWRPSIKASFPGTIPSTPRVPGTRARATSQPPWQSYARDHLLLLDDGKSLAIQEEATGVTLYDPDGLRIAGCRPFGIPAHHSARLFRFDS